jgi:hypothetical protein
MFAVRYIYVPPADVLFCISLGVSEELMKLRLIIAKDEPEQCDLQMQALADPPGNAGVDG